MNASSTSQGNPQEPADAIPLRKVRLSATDIKERLIRFALMACALMSILTTIGIIFVLLWESVLAYGPDKSDRAFFQQVSVVEFFTDTEWTPLFAEKHYGVLPLLSGTMMITGIAALIGIPIGLAGALYLSEFSSARLRGVIKPALEILAGIPTVVYGFFAIVFITPYVLRPVFQETLGISVQLYNAASAGVVVGIMIIPMISSLSEDALRAVPKGLREAGYALGSTRFDVSVRIVLPAASSGIVASFLLAMARAIGETMAVTIAAGSMANLTANPFEPMQTMTAYIVQATSGDAATGTIEYKSLYAVALTLFVITLVMNIVSQRVLRRFREVYE